MPTTWQLQDAKNRLSQVVEKAQREGPQTITVRGKAAVVVVAVEEYRRLAKPRQSLLEFFQSSPLKGIDLDVSRDKRPARDVNL